MQWKKPDWKQLREAWKGVRLSRALGALAILMAVLIPTALVLGRRQETVTVAGGSWGLSFREANVPPVADVSAEELAPYDAKYIGDTQGSVIYWKFADYDPPGAQVIGRRFSAVSSYLLAETPYSSGFASVASATPSV